MPLHAVIAAFSMDRQAKQGVQQGQSTQGAVFVPAIMISPGNEGLIQGVLWGLARAAPQPVVHGFTWTSGIMAYISFTATF